MSDSFVTQCPHCRTSFRVSQAQLAAANGAVRCGACLHVFNAHQHMQAKPATLDVPVATASPIAPSVAKTTAEPEDLRKDPLDTVWIHDDLDLDSLDLDEEMARLEQEELLHPRTPPMEIRPSVSPAIFEEVTPVVADERWAEQLLEESQRSANTKAPLTPVTEAADPEQDSTTAEPWQDLGADSAERQEPTWRDNDDEQATEEEEAGASIEEIGLSEAEAEPPAATGFRANENLFELSDDPLQLQWQAPSKPWGRWLGWGLLNLLAAGALATQYSIYHFDELARQDKYRPWFESVCPQLGCTLPPKVDVNLIKSSNLVVRSHPDFAGALVVDAILYNRASFAQPFPLLELRFSDINNKLLANRRFKPSEYLAGELAGQSEMPPQTPIHISLDILDPGQEAVNYDLTFQSPE